MVEPEFVLGGLKAVFDRPAMSLDLDQSFDARSGRTPGRRRPYRHRRCCGGSAGLASTDRFVRRHIRPRRDQPVRNRPSRAVLRLWFLRQPIGVSMTKGRARAISSAIPAIGGRLPMIGTGGCPARPAHSLCRRAVALFGRQPRRRCRPQPRRRCVCRGRPSDHRKSKARLGREASARRHMSRRHPRRIVRPGLWQIQGTVDEGVAMPRDIRSEHADLAIRNLAG